MYIKSLVHVVLSHYNRGSISSVFLFISRFIMKQLNVSWRYMSENMKNHSFKKVLHAIA